MIKATIQFHSICCGHIPESLRHQTNDRSWTALQQLSAIYHQHCLMIYSVYSQSYYSFPKKCQFAASNDRHNSDNPHQWVPDLMMYMYAALNSFFPDSPWHFSMWRDCSQKHVFS